MDTYALTVEEAPRSEDVQALAQGLTARVLPYTLVPGFQPLAVFLRNEQGAVVGAAEEEAHVSATDFRFVRKA